MTLLVGDLGEVGELAKALGIVDTSGSFRADWFARPGDFLGDVLAEDGQRQALIRFLTDSIGGGAAETDADNLLWVPVVHANSPQLTVYAVLDQRAADYTSIGIGARLTTATPASTVRVHVPVFRAAKQGHTVASPLLLGTPAARIRLSAEIVLDPAVPSPGQAHLGGIGLSVDVPSGPGGAAPRLGLTLKALQLPGTSAPGDRVLDLADLSTLEDTALDLILGLVRAQADALPPTNPLSALAGMLGLRAGAGVPPLPFAELAGAGVTALANWARALLSEPGTRAAWLSQLATLLGGTVSGGEVAVTIGSARVRIGVRVAPGTSGHDRITPVLAAEVDGSTDVLLRAEAELFTLDLGSLKAVALPSLSVFGRFGHGPAVLVDVAGPPHVRVESLRAGIALDAERRPTVLLAADRVTIGTHDHDVLDLTSPDALAEVGSDVVSSLLDGLGPAATALGRLLGIGPPPGVPGVDLGLLLRDPIGAVTGYWKGILTAHTSDVPVVLTALRDLIADAGHATVAVAGDGSFDVPWRIPLAGPVELVAWAGGGPTLHIGVEAGFVVTTFGRGCSSVETQLRVTIVDLDLAAPRASFLAGVDTSLTVRASGDQPARLASSRFAITADRVGLAASWRPASGLGVRFIAPQLRVEAGSTSFALPLPELGLGGELTFAPESWDAVERFLGIVIAASPAAWLHSLLGAMGWHRPLATGPRLRLADLVADPAAALRAWLPSLLLSAETSILDEAMKVLSRIAGTPSGTGPLLVRGSGRQADPYLLALTPAAGVPQLALWQLPHGPKVPATTASRAVKEWRPGDPALPTGVLADALAREAAVGTDVAELLSGRPEPGAGFEALVARWVGTDGRVAPPVTAPAGVSVHTFADATYASGAPELSTVLGTPPAGPVIHVAVAAPGVWATVPAERLVDLSTPGLAPEAFRAPVAAPGDWYVLLGRRADARLATGDPDGVAGQAARLGRVVRALAPLGSLTVVGYGGAGHAARQAAEAEPAVTSVVLVGTPLSPVTFTILDTVPGGDTLRLLHRLLPPADDAEPDDPDLALGRALVEGLIGLTPLGDPAIELRQPAPPAGPPRAGLAVHAAYGVLTEDTVRRALTAIVVAGLADRATRRSDVDRVVPAETRIGLRIPLASPDGPLVVSGYCQLDLAGIAASGPTPGRSVTVHIELRSATGWLVGGPDVGRAPGTAVDHELRWLELDVTVPLGEGAASDARIVLHEVRVFGIERERWVVRPAGTVTTTEIVTPALPEVRVLLSGAVDRLVASPDPTISALLAVGRAVGLIGPVGGAIPDGIDHLLHDPAAHLSGVLADVSLRHDLVTGLRSLLGGSGAGPDGVTFSAGPASITADLAARKVAVELAAGSGSAIAYSGRIEADGTGHAALDLTIGALKVTAAPFSAVLHWARPGLTEPERIVLWPAPDPVAIGRGLARLVPAEAGRTFLELLRGLDPAAKVIMDAAMDALGLLGPVRSDGSRAVILPVALLAAPGAWFGQVLNGLDPTKVIALLDAFKPLLGVTGGPGEWRLAPGIALKAGATAGRLTLAIAVDTGAFTAPDGAARLHIGGMAGLAFPAGRAPSPIVDLYAGLGGAEAGRKAVHVTVDGGLTVFLRPDTGADIPLYPAGPGLGGAVAEAAARALPLVLDAIAAQTAPGVRLTAAQVVSALGDALALRTGTGSGRHFDSAALQAFGRDPAGALVAALPSLTAVVTALGPALPLGATVSVVGSALRVKVGGTTLLWTPSPFAITVETAVTGIPSVEEVQVLVALNGTGLTAVRAQAGPARIVVGGATLRPFVAAAVGSAPEGGRRIELGLGLGGDRALAARWLLGSGGLEGGGGAGLVARDGTVEHSEPAQVALAVLDAVLDLVAGLVLAASAFENLLSRTVGTSTVRKVLQGVILSTADDHALDDDLFDPERLLPRLQTLAVNLADANPSLSVAGGLSLGVRSTPVSGGRVLGLTLGVTQRFDLVQGDVTVALEADARWIKPVPPTAGLAVDLVKVPATGAMTFQPGLAVNGLGVRIGRSSGPLLATVITLDSLALHLFGEIGGGLSGGVQLELAGLAVAVAGAKGGNPVAQSIMGDPGPEKLAPKFSPALAVQKHGNDPVLVSLRAGEGDGPWWLAIQKGFGPLYVEQVGFGVTVQQDQIKRVSLLFDGRVSLFGLTAAVDDLSLTYVVASGASIFDPSRWAVDLAGLALSSDLGGILLQGGLRKFGDGDNVQYVGMLLGRFGVYGLSVFGGYGQGGPPGDRFASFFAFGAINGPIGGPPAFFVTGIGGGVGINRLLVLPTELSHFGEYPLIKALDPGARPAGDPMAQLRTMGEIFPMRRGAFWFAAGVSFTSFALVDGVVVVSVSVGDGLEIALLGLARMALPRPQFALVSIELGLVARFSSKEGVLWVQAQLTDNSWLLYPDVRLTGGFAFVTWFAGPHRGQFVLTIGGYHPSFHRDGYPVVPRLGFQWRLGPTISIKGEQYYALTSEAMMAGGRLEASATFGPAWASLTLGLDAIVYFDPFFLSVTVYARISAGITIDFWIGSVTISISIGARIAIEGPKFHGRATFEVGPVELSIEFGDDDRPKPPPLPWDSFVRKYLEEASPGVARAVTAIAGRGAVPPGTGPGGATDTGTADGSAERPFVVIAEFELTVTTLVPTRTVNVGGSPIERAPSAILGLAPMDIADAASSLGLTMVGPEKVDVVGRMAIVVRDQGSFPAGVWGAPQPAEDRKVPAGDVIRAIEGVTLTAVAKITPGSPEIDYYQVKVRERLPLPFVNSTVARPRVLLDASGLHALVPPVASTGEVLAVSRDWLANAGYGRTTLAAYAGDRAAPPLLGTLAEGLASAEAEATPTYPPAREPSTVDSRVHPPVAIAILTAPVSTPDSPALRTTVSDQNTLPRSAPPTIESVRAGIDRAWPAALIRVAPRADDVQSTVLTRGAVPLTRQARTGAEASALRGSAIDGQLRLASLTSALRAGPIGVVPFGRPKTTVDPAEDVTMLLLQPSRSAAAAAAEPAPSLRAGEIAVLRLPNANRDVDQGRIRPGLMVQGGPARVVALDHSGRVLDDTVTNAVLVARGTERLAVLALGDQGSDPARLTGLAGWYAGMALPYLGSSTALAPGAVLRCPGAYGRRGLARVRAGWVQAAELVAGSYLAETRFAEPVDVVVIAIDDPGGLDGAGRGLALSLSEGHRVVGPPTVVVNGGRSLAVYAVERAPTGGPVTITVASEDGWHLAGVLGGSGTVAQVAARLATAGFGDLLRPLVPGSGGGVELSWRDREA